jgi:hypothetical protein
MIKQKKRTGPIEIDLSGPQGNAYCLLGMVKQLAEQLGKDEKAIQKAMMSGDYKNLVQVFEREFGEFVTLYTDKPEEFSSHEWLSR